MADNTQLGVRVGDGDTMRTLDKPSLSAKVPASTLDVGGTADSEAILGDSGVVFPVANTVKDGSGTFYSPLLDADGHLQIDILSAPSTAVTNAGTFATQATQAGTWTVELGTTDNAVLDAAAASLVDIETNTDFGAVVGGGLEATALRVTIASDSTGVVTVDMATLPDTAAGDLAAINAALGGTLTVGSHAVTLATLPDTAAGDLGASRASLGSIATEVVWQSGAVVTDDADWGAGITRMMVIGGVYQSTPGSITDGDLGTLRLTANGGAHVAVQNTVTVDGSGVTQPVSAASLPLPTGAATEATLVTIDADTGSIDGKITTCDTGAVVIASGTVTTVSAVTNLAQLGGAAVSMNTGVRDAGTQRVTVATNDSVPVTVPTDPFGADADAASTTGSISAKLRQLATDIDAMRGGSEMQVDVVTQPARDRLTDNVGVAQQVDKLMEDVTALEVKFAAINATTNGDNTIVAAVAGKKILVIFYLLIADAAVGAAFEDGAGGTELSGQLPFAANGGVVTGYCPVGVFKTSTNTLLNLETDAIANVRGHLTYVEIT